MKTTKILFVLVLAVVVGLFVACKKSRYCHCASESYTLVINTDTVTRADTAVINVDRDMDCEGIKKMNFRTRDEENANVIYNDRNVTCVELKYTSMHGLPQW